VSLRAVRYIFVSLVVMNLALLGWQVLLSGEDDDGGIDGVGDGSGAPHTLMLLSERASGLVLEDFSPRTERCHAWGPYRDRPSAERAKLEIRRNDVAAWAGRLETPGEGFDYMVYVVPAPSRELAMRTLRELEAMGVESHIVTQGELAGAVSLGIHALEEEAEQVRAQIQDWGYDVVVKQVPRSRVSYWVVGEAAGAPPSRGPKPAESGACTQFAEIMDFN
jgi:hypothetical protein